MNLENKKQLAIILLAVGLGLVSAILTANHIQTSIKKETARLSQEYENKKIKPLVREIKALQKEMKQLATRQANLAARGPGEKGMAGADGSAPSVPKSSLALRTPAGKRAYTVNIDSLSAVGGLINPGDFVDILAHMSMPDLVKNKNSKVSTMVFQNVQILAVGTNLQAPGGYSQQQSARSLRVTFALSPEEASLMSFIERNGKMQLILRPPAETETELMQVANWAALADYVFEKQGTELVIPRAQTGLAPVSVDRKQENVKPFIEMFKGGRAL